MHRLTIILALMITLLPGIGGSNENCHQATQLVKQAFDMGHTPANYPAQKQLLEKALQLCPDQPEALNNLASILEEEQDYDGALRHYQKAVAAKPDFAAAWFGIGEVYYKTGRMPLSLEAYLKACHTDKDARKRIEELLEENRYRISEEGQIMNKESLLLLFDTDRRENIRSMIVECGFSMKADMEPEFIFRNILFDIGTAALKPESHAQIREIGAALKELAGKKITISGHTDKQPFKGYSREESDRMNLKLSEDRAESMAKELKKMGISGIQTKGYGPKFPMDNRNSEEAYAKNRRVTVEVRE